MTLLLRPFRALHRDTRGAIGVLVLLTIWCLVGLIAMLWNTADYSVRRQKIQNAADAIAYSSALQTSRTLNQTAAQNMLIAQDASADIIFRAATDTDNSINQELIAELIALDNIGNQRKILASRIPGLEDRIVLAFTALESALSLVQEDLNAGGMTFSTKNDEIAYRNKVRQAGYAANWVYTSYYTNLTNLAKQAMDASITDQMIDEAKETIGDPINLSFGTEYGIWGLLKSDLDEVPNTPAMMQAHELDLFQDEQELVTAAQSTQQAQTRALAQYHNVLDRDGTPPAVVVPLPVQPAGAVATVPHVDALRLEYPGMGRSPNVTLDPINPNTFAAGDSDIVHPLELIYFDSIPIGPYRVPFSTPGGWGHCSLFPMERYLQGRVAGDSMPLRQMFMVPFDGLRQALAMKWAAELAITVNVPGLPLSIPDTQVDPITKLPTNIPILPILSNSGAAGGKTDPDFAYRRASASFISAINALAAALRNYAGLYNRYTAPYAVPNYSGHLSAERAAVALEVGLLKDFSVLSSYKLYPIPDWAKPGIHDSLVRAISWEIYQRGIPWEHTVDEVYVKINPYVEEIADEMVSRPWPYEKAPPQVPVPPTIGMGKYDRQAYFSSFTVIANQPDGRRGVMFPRLFGDSPPFVAYAQAESINWMEYNENYGDYFTEKFDEVSLNTTNSILACPRAWRLASPGGWNWRARLAPADMMYQAIQKLPNISEPFSNANITKGDRTDYDAINMH